MHSHAAQLSDHFRKNRPARYRSLSRRKPVYGVGCNDADYEVCGAGGRCPAYWHWTSMLKRCYTKGWLDKQPTYAGCSVVPEWHSFMAFREWWISRHIDGYALDKDLLFNGNKVYGPSFCAFVPPSINAFLLDYGAGRGDWPIGVYLDGKRGLFRATCKNGNGKKAHLGHFANPSLAHLAWQRHKLSRLDDLRDQMDAIDPRIYANAKAKILSYAEGLNL